MSAHLKRHFLQKLARSTSSKNLQRRNGFTLVELIVVVVIIGVLSAIAVPAFLGGADKAKQREANVLLAGYVKAAQAYYTENSSWPTSRAQLAEFVSVVGCSTNVNATCKAAAPQDYSSNNTAGSWYSPSGLYQVQWTPGSTSTFRAVPTGTFSTSGYGVSACFNSATGNTKVLDSTAKGTTLNPVATTC